MLRKTVKKVERQTKTGCTYTEETTYSFCLNRRKKQKKEGEVVKKIKDCFRKEITEARNTVIEASFNNLWHTPLWMALTTYFSLYTPYLLMLIPWLTPYAVGVALAFFSYLIAALMLSYLRRLVVWGAGKLKNWFSGNRKQ